MSWESKPLIDLVESEQLMAFRHEGFGGNGYVKRKNLLHNLWVEKKLPGRHGYEEFYFV